MLFPFPWRGCASSCSWSQASWSSWAAWRRVIAGGLGSILGIVLAVLVLGLLTFGMSLNNIPGQVVSVYIGTLLIAVIAITRIVERIRMRSIR